MSRVLFNPGMSRALCGLAGVGAGMGMVKALGGDGSPMSAPVGLLFGLAMLTGLAKTGTA
jgi:hypothetical protein